MELFFDLVFVYSMTQVVRLLHHDFGWHSAGQAVLVFWLVWRAWTQFTWTLNSANTEHTHIQFWTLAATAVAFFMAIALPDAFHGGGLAFAVPYVVVKSIGHGLHGVSPLLGRLPSARLNSVTLPTSHHRGIVQSSCWR